MQKPILICALVATALSGCNLATGDPTDSAFSTPTSAGTLSRAGGLGARSGSDFSSLTGNGYAYQVGSVSDDGLQGFAGIVPGATVTAPPSTGTATMNGTFEVALIDFIMVNGDQVSGQTTLDRGAVTLTADFDAKTVTGGGRGQDFVASILLNGNELDIDGRISGDGLSGTVSYDGVSGPMTGLIGENEAVGAFHGHTDRQVHAGGFIAN